MKWQARTLRRATQRDRRDEGAALKCAATREGARRARNPLATAPQSVIGQSIRPLTLACVHALLSTPSPTIPPTTVSWTHVCARSSEHTVPSPHRPAGRTCAHAPQSTPSPTTSPTTVSWHSRVCTLLCPHSPTVFDGTSQCSRPGTISSGPSFGECVFTPIPDVIARERESGIRTLGETRQRVRLIGSSSRYGETPLFDGFVEIVSLRFVLNRDSHSYGNSGSRLDLKLLQISCFAPVGYL